MDNNNPTLNTNPLVQTPPAAPQNPVPSPAPLSVAPPPQPIPEVPVVSETPEPKKLNLPKVDFKALPAKLKGLPLKYKALGGFVFVLFILLIIVGFTDPGKKAVQQLILPSPSAIPQTTPVGEVFEPSPYANDPEVLEIESKVAEFDRSVSGANLKEDTLRLPSLDWNINFKQ